MNKQRGVSPSKKLLKEVSEMVKTANAFSISMLPEEGAVVEFKKVTAEEVKELLKEGFESAIGHQATAEFLKKLLGIEIPVNRTAIKLQKGDTLVVMQLFQRLPEGKILTEEEIKKIPHAFYIVRVLDD